MFSLQQAYEALNNHSEFVVKDYDGLLSFDYIITCPGSFAVTEQEIQERAHHLWQLAGEPSGDGIDFWLKAEKDCNNFAAIRRNFRGVTFDKNTGEILSLPLHKFFNINQTPETSFDLLKNCKATIYEKCDGSMIHFLNHPIHGLQAATCRSTQTPQAKSALALAKKHQVHDRILESIQNGYTPIFEYVGLSNQIVVEYPVARLVYLVSRNRKSGEYLIEDYPDKANTYTFSFDDIFNQLSLEGFEGYVCHLDNGMFVKAKTPWYIERHRAVDALMRPAYKLYKVVFDGIMDDLIALVVDNYKPVLTAIYNEAQQDLLREKLAVEKQFQTVLDELDKTYVQIPLINKLVDFEKELADLFIKDKFAAYKRFREFTGFGLLDAKKYFETGRWPHGFIIHDEIKEEENKKKSKKLMFIELVNKLFPHNFHLLMELYNDQSPDQSIKDRLMEIYRVKYPNKLFASLDVEDG